MRMRDQPYKINKDLNKAGKFKILEIGSYKSKIVSCLTQKNHLHNPKVKKISLMGRSQQVYKYPPRYNPYLMNKSNQKRKRRSKNKEQESNQSGKRKRFRSKVLAVLFFPACWLLSGHLK